jgi:hypothetical protein
VTNIPWFEGDLSKNKNKFKNLNLLKNFIEPLGSWKQRREKVMDIHINSH